MGCSQLSPSPPLVEGETMAEEISHPSPLEEISLNTGRQSGPRCINKQSILGLSCLLYLGPCGPRCINKTIELGNNFLNRSEPSSPMIRAQSTEEMRADLELVNLGKENLGGEEEGSPLFKRPSSLCVKTPVSLKTCHTNLLRVLC